jgi:iron(III) transport system ATP-binding protein
MLSVRGLSKRFAIDRGAVAALKNVSFDVEQGELFVLVGDSGSGKTTLLRCIAGLEVPEIGEICIGGHVMSSGDPPTWIPPQRRRLGMVFQSYAVWPHLTVYDNVALPLREGTHRIERGEVDRRVREALELVELQQLAQRAATLLSGGQQQRVALARAIAVNSRMLLMDEPLSNLDARLREDVRERIRNVAKQLGSTVVYVTHDQVEAMAIADRIGLLKDGELVQVGTPWEVYRHPCQPAVAAFFGQVNWLEASRCGPGTVTTSIGVLRIPPDGSLNNAEHLLIGIRPECVVPVGESSPRDDANILDGRLTSTAFLGEHVVSRVRVDGHELISKSRSLPVSQDGCVRVVIEPGDIMAFPHDGGTNAIDA